MSENFNEKIYELTHSIDQSIINYANYLRENRFTREEAVEQIRTVVIDDINQLK